MLRDQRGRASRAIDLFGRGGSYVRRRVFLGLYDDRKPVAGDETARGGEQHRERDVARLGRREQDAQRIMLIEMGEPGRAITSDKSDLRDAVCAAAALPDGLSAAKPITERSARIDGFRVAQPILLHGAQPRGLGYAISRPRSRIGALWVIQPEEIRSTPAAAIAGTLSRVIRPEASVTARPATIATARRSVAGSMLSSSTASTPISSASEIGR